MQWASHNPPHPTYQLRHCILASEKRGGGKLGVRQNYGGMPPVQTLLGYGRLG